MSSYLRNGPLRKEQFFPQKIHLPRIKPCTSELSTLKQAESSVCTWSNLQLVSYGYSLAADGNGQVWSNLPRSTLAAR